MFGIGNKKVNDFSSITKAIQSIMYSDKNVYYDLNFDAFRDDVINNPAVSMCWDEIRTSFKNIKFGVYKLKDGKNVKVENSYVDRTLANPSDLLTTSDLYEYLIFYKLFGGIQVVEKRSGIFDATLNILAPTKIASIKYDDRKLRVSSIVLDNGTVIRGSDLKNIFIKSNVDPRANIAGMTSGYTHYQALAQVADLLNFILKHNISLTKNSGNATGLFMPKNDTNQTMSPKLLDKLEEKIKSSLNSYKKAGMSKVLPFAMDYVNLNTNPKDLDWVKGYELGVKMVAGIMGVPLNMVTTEGSTFNNVSESRKSFNKNTIIPMAKDMSEYLTKIFDKNLNEGEFIYYDRSSIVDLESETDETINMLIKADFLTINEKRNLFMDKTGKKLNELKGEELNEILVGANQMLASDLSVTDIPEEG